MQFNTAFQDIRNYLAGRAIGITRDRALLHEVVKCLFSYLYHLRDIPIPSNSDLSRRYESAFDRVKGTVPDVFSAEELIRLDSQSICFIHDRFLQLDFDDPRNDPLSELYQAFIGSDVRGSEGQFFTPTEAVRWLVEAVAPAPGEKIIDPACGAGSFLSYSARYLRERGVEAKQIAKQLYGIEKDEYLAHLAKTHIALASLGTGNVLCGDSIEGLLKDGGKIPVELGGDFDIVLANPPFGAKIKVGSIEARHQFDLAYRWVRDSTSRTFNKTEKLNPNPTPQMLFLELCIKLLRPGGRMGIVVPESLIASSSSGYVVQFLLEHAELLAVVGMPESLFKTSGKGGTHTKTCLLLATKKGHPSRARRFFMAEARWCGHDSRGNPIPRNDLPTLLNEYQAGESRPSSEDGRLGYFVAERELRENSLAPRYYNPGPIKRLAALETTHELIKMGDLVDAGILKIATGDEVGKLAYGTGDIPFVRTSDISNWEVKLDPKHGVSEEIYHLYARKQDVQEGDILMVRDGTYLIGTCAYISKYDTRIVYQSHLYKLRICKPNEISPYLLLAALSSRPVLAQIQAKRMTQDIIDTLGKRVLELVLPIPRDSIHRRQIEEMVERSIQDRIESRELARRAVERIAHPASYRVPELV